MIPADEIKIPDRDAAIAKPAGSNSIDKLLSMKISWSRFPQLVAKTAVTNNVAAAA
jgi:hypothetical protein